MNNSKWVILEFKDVLFFKSIAEENIYSRKEDILLYIGPKRVIIIRPIYLELLLKLIRVTKERFIERNSEGIDCTVNIRQLPPEEYVLWGII